jgi:hypothetical protein
MVDDVQQSDVWASFRVGRRAKIVMLEEKGQQIAAMHDGYKSVGVAHKRSWEWNSQGVVIIDELKGKTADTSAIAYFHFHPDISVAASDYGIEAGPLFLKCEGSDHVEIATYDYAAGFNNLIPARVLKVQFTSILRTTLIIR